MAFEPATGMSCTDQLVRAWGHDDNYESDDNGACASWFLLDSTDRRLLAVAATIDHTHAANCDRRLLGRSGHAFVPLPYAVGDREALFVRSDDRGFWNGVECSADEARRYLAEWAEVNVPTYCDACSSPMSDDEADAYGDACERCAVSFFHCAPLAEMAEVD